MLVLPRVLSVLANLFMVYFESVFLSSIWLRSPDDIFALQPLDFPVLGFPGGAEFYLSLSLVQGRLGGRQQVPFLGHPRSLLC